MTDDAISKLYVTKSLVKYREMVEHLVIYVELSNSVIS